MKRCTLALAAFVVLLPATQHDLRATDGDGRADQLQIEQHVPVPKNRGVIYGDAFGESLAEDGRASMKAVAGVSLSLTGPGVPRGTNSNVGGRFRFGDLDRGTYKLTATDGDGRSYSVDVEVLPGVATRVNWLIDPRKDNGVYPSWASVAVDDGAPNADFDGNGFVGLSDLDLVRANQGLDPEKATGDLNGDGVINQRDVQALKKVFGRAVIRVPALVQAQVTPGGSTADLGNGSASVVSGEGYTKGTLTRTANPGVVRFTVLEDRGKAYSPELGEFTFTENKDNPTWVEVDLNTGLVLDGEMTLLFNDGPFLDGASATAEIDSGAVALAAGGFCAYRMVQVEGVVRAEFAPFLAAETTFAMDKGDEKKEDVACATVAAPVGDPLCAQGGTKCADDGADCASGGACRTCKNIVTGDAGGVRCQGCSCFP
ncbi:MAG: hypothetical protein AAF481_02780 [Acidobacteriota bacterium]